MEIKVKLKYLRQAPRKVRSVASVIRGLDVEKAGEQLRFSLRRPAGPILKLLNSAIANAENNHKLKRDNLFIKEIRVDEGPTLKRWRARAFGRAAGIGKRSSHIIMVLAEKKPTLNKIESKEEVNKKKDNTSDVKVVNSLDEIKTNPESEQEDESKKSKVKTDNDFDDKDKITKEKFGRGSENFNQSKGGSGWKSKIFRRKAG